MNDQTNTQPVALNPHVTWYRDLLANWPGARECGAKPSRELLSMVHWLDPKKRPGVEALHIAMALRDGGCTVRQFQVAGSCGPANNYRRALVNAGLIKVSVEGKPYAYVATLTAKGQAAIARNVKAAAEAAPADKAADKPAKAAKAKRKARKAADKPAGEVTAPAATEQAPAETPTSEHAPVTEGHTAETQPQA